MKKEQRNFAIQDSSQIDTYLETEGSIINLWGEKGIGKTYLLQKFESSLRETENNGAVIKDLYRKEKNETQIEWLDFSQFTDWNEMTRLEIIYSICHILKDKFGIPNPTRFLMADKVDSERKKRKSYLEREEFSTLNTVTQAYEMISTFVEFPGVGKAIKVMQVGDKIYRKYRPKNNEEKEYYRKYRQLSSQRDLAEELPSILKEDLEDPLTETQNKILKRSLADNKKIVIIDNFNPDKPDFENWINSLIDNNQGINWILVSRHKLKLLKNEAKYIEITPLNRDQVTDLAGFENTDENKERIDKFYELTRGIPLLVILLAGKVQTNMNANSWNELRKSVESTDFIAKSVLDSMDINRKELLFHLVFIQDFDAQSFSHFFPGKFFWLYADWFESSIFTKHGEKYIVQQTVRDAIIEYLRSSYSAVIDVINKELFIIERNWLQLNSRNSARNTAKEHIQKFCYYGQQLDDYILFYDALIQVRDLILVNQGYYYYQLQLCNMLNRLNEDSSDNIGYISSLKVSVYEDLCHSEIQCGRLVNARDHAEKALKLLPDPEIEPEVLHLYFYSILLNSEYSSHDNSGKTWIETIKELGGNYFQILQKLEIAAFYEFQLRCDAELIVIKSLVNNEEYKEAEKLINELKNKFDSLPKVQQSQFYKQMGKVWQLDGERLHNSAGKNQIYAHQNYLDSEASLAQSRKYFENAEAISQQWDQDLLLESGLTYKRSAENYFKFEEDDPDNKLAFQFIDKAVEQYYKVINHVPDVMEAYCRVGWAYLTALHCISEDDRYSLKSSEYLEKCDKLINDLLENLEINSLEEVENWKVHNIICDVDRYYIQHYSSEQKRELVYEKLLESDEHCLTYLKVANNHPYALRVYARQCINWAKYYEADNLKKQSWIKKGLEYCDLAESNSNDNLCTKQREMLMNIK